MQGTMDIEQKPVLKELRTQLGWGGFMSSVWTTHEVEGHEDWQLEKDMVGNVQILRSGGEEAGRQRGDPQTILRTV